MRESILVELFKCTLLLGKQAIDKLHQIHIARPIKAILILEIHKTVCIVLKRNETTRWLFLYLQNSHR